MGDVVNLNRYRKQRQQAERERRANAVSYTHLTLPTIYSV